MSAPGIARRDCASPRELAAALADHIASRLHKRLAEAERASLVLSGGGTPVLTLRHLAAHGLPWSRVDVTLSDERWVAPDHAASNAGMLAREFLVGDVRDATFYSLYCDAPTAADAEARIHDRLSIMSRPFDVVLLGMGNDGHTASLFPGAPGLDRAMDPHNPRLCQAMQPQDAPHARMSLTLAALRASREILLLIAGQAKRATLVDVMKGSDVADKPVRGVLLQHETPVTVFWSPDEEKET